MTRGRHAASAAKRRAENAQQELDRLYPKLVDAERQLKMYRSEAEAAPALRRALAEMRDQVGMPHVEHVRVLAEQDAKHDEKLERITEALIEVWAKLVKVGALHKPTNENWINVNFMDRLRELPRDASLALLRHLGLERDMARNVLRPGLANEASKEGRMGALAYARMAHEHEGRTDRMIPAQYIDGVRSLNDVLDRLNDETVGPYEIKCPTCLALPERPCRSQNGARLEEPHETRVTAAANRWSPAHDQQDEGDEDDRRP